uniref:Large ribosomal subunit protein bL28c n=1 Tax=Bostrychia moritziana TaxID=103713 RepID=A0A1Z1M6B6_BOSMO|nr:ribosomal protein L28 [Bostrychia moritziana]ARW61637.1 ribosomal protein L28 [Bostrychia moritziana]
MSRVCQISGKKANNGYSVSHSHVKTKKKQNINLQRKKIWSRAKGCWIRKKISTKAIKSFYKVDL